MIGNLCQDEFWDLNLTWNSDNPDFTRCFQETVLILLPSLFFFPILVISLGCILKNSVAVPLPWTMLNVAKMILTISLISISSSEFGIHLSRKYSGENIADSTIFSTCVRTVDLSIILVLMLIHRRFGTRSSTLLSIYWLCFSFCGTIIYRSSFLRFFGEVTPSLSQEVFILNMLQYPLIYAQLFLSVFSDANSYHSLEKGSPMDEEPFFSFISFVWFTNLIYKGAKKHLTIKDFPPLSINQKASHLWEKFQAHWNFLSMPPEGAISESIQLKAQSLACAIGRAFRRWITYAFLLDLVFVFARMINPLILSLIIDFISSDEPAWKGYLYSVAIVVSNFSMTMLYNNYLFWTSCYAGQVKSALIEAIYRKSMRISNSSRGSFASGALANLISVDVERIVNFSSYFTALFCAPLKIVLTVLFLWQYLGVSCLAGILVILLLIPMTLCISTVGEKLCTKQMAVKDVRVKYMNEILSGIKVLKLYAWEFPFMGKITTTRQKEMKLILASQLCYVVMSFVYSCAPIMVAIATFTTYLLIDENHVLDPSTVFVSVTLMNTLRYAIFEVPDAISEVIQTNISLGRLRKFFYAEEYDFETIGSEPDFGDVLSIRDATFSWAQDSDAVLKNINLHVKKGKLVAVIGPVGCGKSSLLSAILGEMPKKWGTIDIQGSMAYVPQQPWILNKSVKENILLVKSLQENRYREILDNCCLNTDLQNFPASDETEIGEKGVNLSGGQKQRVSLARAVFQDANVYLLDDPLSAVDAHVRKDLFDDVVGNTGLLKRKTRILVTHDISVLPKVDTVVSMRDGKIEEVGTYTELMRRQGNFAEFVREHLTGQESIETSEEPKTLEQVLLRLQSEDSQSSLSLEASPSTHLNSTKQIQFESPEQFRGKAAIIEEEKMEIGKVSRSVYLSYVKHAGYILFITGILGSISCQTFEIAGNVWLSKWSTDASLTNSTDQPPSKTMRIAVYVTIGSCQLLSFLIGLSCLVVASTKASSLYHKKMLLSVMRSPMSFFDKTPIGRIINRFSSDMDIVDVLLVYEIDGWLQCLFACLGVFLVVGVELPLFLAALVPVLGVYYMLQKVYLNTSRQMKRLESTTRSPIYSHFLETLQGASSIKAYRVENQFVEKLRKFLDSHITCYFYGTICDRWLSFWLSLLGSVVIIVATVLAVENRGVLSAAVVGLTITYVLSVTECLTMLVKCSTELENKTVSVERLEEYCNLSSEASWDNPKELPHIQWPQEGSISFQGFSAKYREDLDLVLKKLDFEVGSNEKVGIVGRTGAGKSSVTLALFRIIESSAGRIVIDHVDISKIGLHTLRSKLTIIPQDPVLFTGSLRLNVDPNEEHNDEAIWESLEQAHLKQFASSLPGGLDYELTEGGENLSVGQKQLICLSRALLKKTKILVLDEATAAVDMDTDRIIQNTIRTQFENHTVITVAHRLNTVMDYDKIIVMEAGTIAEVGNPSELLKDSKSKFYLMAKDAGLI